MFWHDFRSPFLDFPPSFLLCFLPSFPGNSRFFFLGPSPFRGAPRGRGPLLVSLGRLYRAGLHRGWAVTFAGAFVYRGGQQHLEYTYYTGPRLRPVRSRICEPVHQKTSCFFCCPRPRFRFAVRRTGSWFAEPLRIAE